uniref:cGMP-dependent protein kinase n=1 Tax=Pinguiococcus pyrenoidosus TaxID=172671 RepID=A0A7R9UBQ4_9STRA|mmetsp:Transcript_2938/g.11902  ORF Transcript_2938/g.11902 Transcript_2938/m.11902 type:complete len:1516 (+) Transcript_2938:52-4599(+)
MHGRTLSRKMSWSSDSELDEEEDINDWLTEEDPVPRTSSASIRSSGMSLGGPEDEAEHRLRRRDAFLNTIAHLYWRHLPEEQRERMLQDLEDVYVPIGDKILSQGDAGDSFYFVYGPKNAEVAVVLEKDATPAEGDTKVEAVLDGLNAPTNTLRTHLGVSSYFGEGALIHGTGHVRSATVLAVCAQTPGSTRSMHSSKPGCIHLLRVSAQAFADWEPWRQQLIVKDVPLLKNLTPKQRLTISSKLQRETFPVGEQIIRQGDVGDKFFIIVGGCAEVVDEGEEAVLTRLYPGHHFGEMALLYEKPRVATVRAVLDEAEPELSQECVCLTLTKEDFWVALEKGDAFADRLDAAVHRILTLRDRRNMWPDNLLSIPSPNSSSFPNLSPGGLSASLSADSVDSHPEDRDERFAAFVAKLNACMKSPLLNPGIHVNHTQFASLSKKATSNPNLGTELSDEDAEEEKDVPQTSSKEKVTPDRDRLPSIQTGAARDRALSVGSRDRAHSAGNRDAPSQGQGNPSSSRSTSVPNKAALATHRGAFPRQGARLQTGARQAQSSIQGQAPRRFRTYELVHELGKGTYASVWTAKLLPLRTSFTSKDGDVPLAGPPRQSRRTSMEDEAHVGRHQRSESNVSSMTVEPDDLEKLNTRRNTVTSVESMSSRGANFPSMTLSATHSVGSGSYVSPSPRSFLRRKSSERIELWLEEDLVAVKVIQRGQGARRRRIMAAVAAEVRVCRFLQPHPNLTQLFEAIEEPLSNTICLVQEHCAGGTLNKRMSEEEARQCMRHVSLGLLHMHNNGIVHGDIKPENLLVKFAHPNPDAANGPKAEAPALSLRPNPHPNLLVKICDFGSARFVEPLPAQVIDVVTQPSQGDRAKDEEDVGLFPGLAGANPAAAGASYSLSGASPNPMHPDRTPVFTAPELYGFEVSSASPVSTTGSQPNASPSSATASSNPSPRASMTVPQVDKRAADVWALGVTLYYWIFGCYPWNGRNELLLSHQLSKVELTFPDETSEMHHIGTPHLRNVLRRMLDKNPRTRITMAALVQHEWLTHEGADPLLSPRSSIYFGARSSMTNSTVSGSSRKSSAMGLNLGVNVHRRLVSTISTHSQESESSDASTVESLVLTLPLDTDGEEFEKGFRVIDNSIRTVDNDGSFAPLTEEETEIYHRIRSKTKAWANRARLDLGLRVGLSESKGRRKYMEDKSQINLNFSKARKETSPKPGAEPPLVFAGLYDGHNGVRVAEVLSESLHDVIKSTSAFSGDLCEAIANGFLTMDSFILAAEHRRMKLEAAKGQSIERIATNSCPGACGIVAIIKRSGGEDSKKLELSIGSVGDCRAVLCCGGQAIQRNEAHNHANRREKLRVEANGGSFVNGRLFSQLAVTRAFGDFHLKKFNERAPAVADDDAASNDSKGARPRMLGEGEAESIVRELWETDTLISKPQLIAEFIDSVPSDDANTPEFLLIASDGLWDVMSMQDSVNFIRRQLLVHCDLQRCARELVETCIDLGSEDNVSVIIILFGQN